MWTWFVLSETIDHEPLPVRAFAREGLCCPSILEKDPEALRDLQPSTPPALERVVKRCLAKDPEERWQSTSDLASELKWIAEAGGTVAAASSEAVAKGRRRDLLYRVEGISSTCMAARSLHFLFHLHRYGRKWTGKPATAVILSFEGLRWRCPDVRKLRRTGRPDYVGADQAAQGEPSPASRTR